MPTPVRLLVRIHLPVSSGPRNKAVSSRTRHVISGVKQKAPKEEHLLEADIHIHDRGCADHLIPPNIPPLWSQRNC